LQRLLQGVDLVWRGLESILSKHHVQEIEALGRPFNPALHEAMAQIPDASVEPNTIVEVLQKGYQLRERLVRPARVVVARAPDVPDGGGAASGES
jgi:molecular chaperone GrpE